MRSTFTKIFLSFWLTQALFLVASGFFLYSDFLQSEAVYTSDFAQMESSAKQQLAAYAKGGCPAMLALPAAYPLDLTKPGAEDLPSLLVDHDGHVLCRQVDMAPLADVLNRIRRDHFTLPRPMGKGFVQGVEARDAAGQPIYFLMRASYPSQFYVPYREMLPRLFIALIASVLVSGVITIFITRPIGRLRTAAREMAGGNLGARVKMRRPLPSKGDELEALVYDFNNMAERLESVVDAQKLLLRDVSHELRSPLARLSVALELAREEAQSMVPEDERSALSDQLERIERETGRLNQLIGQLLSLSHLESTGKLPEGAALSLNDLVAELMPDMEYEATGRHCRVRLSLPAASLEVKGNRELLGRAVENVVRNAIAYTAEGTAVEIALSRVEMVAGDGAVLTVRDHGPGVPPEGLKSIFRPFYRMDLSRQRATGGYGVGLAITERAIRLHGGEVEAANASGGGLEVTMRLPLA